MKTPASAMAVVTEEQLSNRARFSPDVVGAVSWAWELQGTGSTRLTKKIKILSSREREIIAAPGRQLPHGWSNLEITALAQLAWLRG